MFAEKRVFGVLIAGFPAMFLRAEDIPTPVRGVSGRHHGAGLEEGL